LCPESPKIHLDFVCSIQKERSHPLDPQRSVSGIGKHYMVQADSSVKGDRFERYSGGKLVGLGTSCSPWKSFWMSRHATFQKMVKFLYDDEKPYYEHVQTPGEVSVSETCGGGRVVATQICFGILTPKNWGR